jgi:ABC-type glycerol-3-phosphate transport system substrate-binding protein
MKSFVKITLMVMMGVLTAPVFAGSGQQSGGKTTLTMSRWAGPHADDQKIVLRDYMAAHPNINVVMDDIDYMGMKQKQITSIQQPAGRGQYDLLFVFGIWTDEYISNGYILPLDDYIAKAGIDMSIYNQDFLAKETRNGKLYAFPARPEVQVLTYNTEWLARDGKSIPATMDEVIALARFYKEQGTGIAIPAMQNDPAGEIFATLMFSEGGDFIDPATGRLQLDTDAAKYAARTWGELCKYAIVGSSTWHTDGASQAIREGKAPFGFTAAGLAMLNGYPDQSAIVGKAEYRPVPTRKPLVSCASYWGWGIAANTPNPQEAFNFLAWLVSPETEKKQSMMNGQTTCINTTLGDPEIASKYPFFGAVRESMQRIKTLPTSIKGAEMVQRIQAAMNEIATTGRNPETVLAEVQAEYTGVDLRQ